MLKTKFLSDSIIYFVSQIINKAIPFLLLPIITRYLSPEEYGTVVSFTAFLNIIIIFVGLSLNGAINVNYFKSSHESMRKYVFNALLILIVSTIITSIIIVSLEPILSPLISISIQWMLIAVAVAFFQFITLINLGLWQAEQKAKAYGAYEILQSILIAVLVLVLIVFWGMKGEGVILSTTVGMILFGLLSFGFLLYRNYIDFSISTTDIKDLLSFGLPMIPHQLSGWILLQYDKIFIISMLGLSVAGIYAVGAQIGMIISLITLAFNKAWTPYLYKKLSTNPSYQEKVKLVKFTYLYYLFLLILAYVISFISPLLIDFFLGEKYIDASQYIGYITFAFAFNGMYFMVVNYIFYVKKTHILALVTFANSIIYIFLSYVLLQSCGAMGVAYATLISYFLSFVFIWKVSNVLYPMPWFYWRSHV